NVGICSYAHASALTIAAGFFNQPRNVVLSQSHVSRATTAGFHEVLPLPLVEVSAHGIRQQLVNAALLRGGGLPHRMQQFLGQQYLRFRHSQSLPTLAVHPADVNGALGSRGRSLRTRSLGGGSAGWARGVVDGM